MLADLVRAVDNEAPREERAIAAAAMIRDAGEFRRVRIYDVGDEYVTLIGSAGEVDRIEQPVPINAGLNGEAASTRYTAVGNHEAVVPVLGAESGVVIGTLAARRDRSQGLSPEDVAFLEDCAAALRPLYD